MSGIILHQYAASPFSEKVRALLGYKKVAYQIVEIPVIMPKPELMALTGGYRKTPVMQIGADIYCDTAIICKVIDRMFPGNTVYPKGQEAVLGTAIHWTDTFFFKVSVAMAFQPKALAKSELFSDPEAASAFMADRAEFSKGSTELGMKFSVAYPHWLMHMKRLDAQLSNADYLGGTKPNILDFSTYHCCWFVHNNEAIRDGFDPFGNVLRWLGRMADFGHGETREISGADAIEVAQSNQASTAPKIAAMSSDDLAAGDPVEIMPIDYGFQPTAGELLIASLEELSLVRVDDVAGKLVVHFPRLGFQVTKV